jgi:cyclopropane-fatty-acyl-phospholipid synthase
MGLAESYAEDVWTAEPNPKEFLSLLIRAKSRKVSDNFRRSFLKRIWAFGHSSKRAKNTVAQAHRNAQDHYDLGNDMFRLFLDRSLTYSCAIFEGENREGPFLSSLTLLDLEKAKLTVREAPMKVIEEILYNAQMHKYDAILDGLGTVDLNKSAGCHVLEIGCGWGAFSIRAVERHRRLKWTGLTLSKVFH